MGGRDIERLCVGADPGLAHGQVLRQLTTHGVSVEHGGQLLRMGGGGETVPVERAAEFFDARQRATLAASYAAQETAHCVEALGAAGPLTVDGPLAGNEVYLEMLAALLGDVHASTDAIEGTARGGYVLAHWSAARTTPPRVRAIPVPADAGLLRSQLVAMP
jgi:sugar (pentulose or hexulose) kinase